MSNQAAVEVYREGEEDNQHRYQHYTGGPSRDLGEVVELDPAEYGDLQQEQQQSQQRGERPSHFDVPVQAFVRRLVHQAYAVQVADRFYVRQDTRRYHQGQHVHRHEQRRADGEGDQHLRGDLRFGVQLNLYHSDLERYSL